MASAVAKEPSKVAVDVEDDEEELFEIDIEAVNSIPPPHYWESYFTAAGSSALLANCLLPIADVSSAVPTPSTVCNALSLAEQLMFFRSQTPHQSFQELLLGSNITT
ncbi:conserved hypothetical protein [Ricinus communis]|uniref:Uncharacterized protein n=2 Tax=Ricinus communis TaxID=3988 RepID=B9SRW0_RICCO|nr:conserved hypothetical protein [Ricinus communis]